ncbi:hypothetical protein COOONC_00781 [Cooperia oncophora]
MEVQRIHPPQGQGRKPDHSAHPFLAPLKLALMTYQVITSDDIFLIVHHLNDGDVPCPCGQHSPYIVRQWDRIHTSNEEAGSKCVSKTIVNHRSIPHKRPRYVLPISPTDKDAKVRLRTLEESGILEHTMVCDRAEFCEHQYFLSKGCQKDSAIGPPTPQRSEQTVPSPNACGFELIQLPRSTLSICVILSLASLNSACQHGFMRHSAELVCNENNHCHLEYSRELLFNRLQSELCIEIWHANKSVGLAKFVRKSVELNALKSLNSSRDHPN